jgi:hypothetical protein
MQFRLQLSGNLLALGRRLVSATQLSAEALL